jgi:ketosteroid isomerase-like protein
MVEAEINASTERFLQELARGEAAAAASTYDEDAILLPRPARPSGDGRRSRASGRAGSWNRSSAAKPADWSTRSAGTAW